MAVVGGGVEVVVFIFFSIRNCLSVIRVESRANLCKVRRMSIRYSLLFIIFPEYLCLVLFEVKLMSARCASCWISGPGVSLCLLYEVTGHP